MKKIIRLLIISLIAFSSCKKDNFFDKFPPEVLFYQNERVENADFVQTTLPAGTTDFMVKARVSAPLKLKEIKLYRNDALVETYTDFRLVPTVYDLRYVVPDITAATTMKVHAVDMDNKVTERTFAIQVTP